MWEASVDRLTERSHKYRLYDGSEPLSYADIAKLWRDSESFRTFFTAQLSDSPFSAFRWETPPVTRSTVTQVFEFVLLKADALQRQVDRTAFASHFDAAPNQAVVAFANLGGDAELVVPCPCSDDSAYGHLAVFVRRAPSAQVDQLWSEVGNCMARRISEQPVWLSTAGMGVSWLHVRLDSRPKYYGHQPYTQLARIK